MQLHCLGTPQWQGTVSQSPAWAQHLHLHNPGHLALVLLVPAAPPGLGEACRLHLCHRCLLALLLLLLPPLRQAVS
jgi:hypothetical protein